ncbi:MAG: TldD/PmbA family protein [Christensenellaceae bacterium]|jgi:PmbA protein|nr:TldD/PmbA family protein [Christensenellaceae bacterium]
MDDRAFCERAFALALKQGCEAAEMVLREAQSFSVGVLQGEIDTYSVSRERSLGLRVQRNGKDGYAATEVPENPEQLVRAALDNAISIQSEDGNPMAGPAAYPPVPTPADALKDMDAAGKIALCRALEKAALGADARVRRTAACKVITEQSRVRLRNTLGLNALREDAFSACYVAPIVVGQAGEAQEGGAFRARGEAADIEACAREAVEEALGQLGAAPVPPGLYRILLRNDAAYSLLAAFSGLFSADAAQKGLSLLAGKEGQRIAAACVNLRDDALAALNPRPFDDEGVPAQNKAVVREGVLVTLLHSLKTAQKAGVRSTGNAGRAGGAGGPVGVRPSNFFICPGEAPFDQLLQALGDGLLITELSGLHAGVNAISGEFSLSAKGFWVRGGKMGPPVKQIVLSGSFLALLQGIQAVGNDTRYSMPSGACFGSPSLLLGELRVAGAGKNA